MISKLAESKRLLYSLLMEKEPDSLTETEVNIMMELSKDQDVQGIFDSNIFKSFNIPDYEQSCMYNSCQNCNGTGVDFYGKICIHYISCGCSKCNPTYTTNY
jgi:hypothetical protein